MRGAYPTLRLHGSPACGAFFLADFQRFVGFPPGPVANRAALLSAAIQGPEALRERLRFPILKRRRVLEGRSGDVRNPRDSGYRPSLPSYQ